jgi:cell wall-associated NlpC family hydrolase
MNRRALRLVPIAILMAMLGTIVTPGVVVADPISDKQAQAAQLDAEINTNATKLDALNEQINEAQIRLQDANNAIANANALVLAAQAKTKELHAEVARRAASVYTQSGSSGGIADLDAQNAQDLSTRQKYSSLAAQRDNQIVSQLAQAKEQLALRKADADKARQAAQTESDAIQAQHDKLAEGTAALQKLQSQVKGELATLVQQAEDARKAREAAVAAAQYKIQVANTSTRSRISATPPPTSGKVSAVIAYAYSQLGKPYCYGGAGPDCFDCSGLTMMAWAQAGVTMSHGSSDQMASFPSVSMDELQPGDLVFWNGHVGIYVGNGSVLHAPHTGTVVQITPIWSGVIGAARPS